MTTSSSTQEITEALVEQLRHHHKLLGYAGQTHLADVQAMCAGVRPIIEQAINALSHSPVEDVRKAIVAFRDEYLPSGLQDTPEWRAVESAIQSMKEE